MQGKTVAQIAAMHHRDTVETVFDIVLAEGGHRTDAVYAIMNEPDVQAGNEAVVDGREHRFRRRGARRSARHTVRASPRLRIVPADPRPLCTRSEAVPLEFAVRKMTSLAAQRVNLSDRGS